VEAPDGQDAHGRARVYRIVATRQSPDSGDAALVVDGDAATVWSTDPGADPAEAWVVLDLGNPRTIGRVRWLVAADGLAGRMRIEFSTDGKRWQQAAEVKEATTGDQEASASWQEWRLKQPMTARYVRVVFTHPNGDPRLGGLAELEVAAPATAKGHRGGPTHDRHRAEPGHTKATSGHERATSRHERATSGHKHNGAKDPHGDNKDQRPNQDKDRNAATSSRKRGQQRRGS